jgi:hypothetical protein
MICPRCGKESGNLFCGKCRAEITSRHNLVPVLFYDKLQKGYRAGCSVISCPANENGVCISVTKDIALIKFHEYDGDNCIRMVCG